MMKKTQQIPLKYMKPTALSRLLFGTKKDDYLIPKGITTLVPSDGEAVLAVEGTPESIEELKSLIRLLDIEPTPVVAKIRLLRRTSDSKQAIVLADFFIKTTNNAPAALDLLVMGERMHLSFTPHANNDISVGWSVESQKGEAKTQQVYQRQRVKTLYYPIVEEPLKLTIQSYLKSVEGKDMQDGALLPPGDYIELTMIQIGKRML
jgi:hypothetical protein